MSYTTLISAAELQGLLAATTPLQPLVLLDCQANIMDAAAGHAAYLASHLPGAQHADLDLDLAAPVGNGSGGRHPLPVAATLLQKMCAWGIGDTSQVVVYDNAGAAFAARAWWCLRWLGHRDVAVLDGGLGGYLKHYPDAQRQGPEPTPTLGELTKRTALTRTLDAQGVLNRVVAANRTGATNLLDARDAKRFAGAVEPIDPVAGHIPGATCMPFQGNLDEAQHFLSTAELTTRFVGADADTVCYCGSGVTAAHNILAMVHAGLPEPMLYPGSWSEWITDATRPRAAATDAV